MFSMGVVASYFLLPSTSANHEPSTVSITASNDERHLILLNARSIDVNSSTMTPEQWSIDEVVGNSLQLVRFKGPIQSEWVKAIENAGAEIVDYIPHYTYLIWAEPDAISRIRSFGSSPGSPLEWVGLFRAEYRIHPSLYAPDGSAVGDHKSFLIQLVLDKNTNNETLAFIDSIKTSEIRGMQTVRHFVNFVVGLDATSVKEVAERPDVISIYPFAEPRKMDERQDLILRGNLNGSEPAHSDYLEYLHNKGFTQEQFDVSDFVVDLTDSGVDNGNAKNPDQFLLRRLGDPRGASRLAYSRVLGTPSSNSTRAGCDGHGNLNATIIAGFVPSGGIFDAFPHADSSGYRYGLGVAPFIKIGSSVVFDPTHFTFPSFPDLQSRAYANGARISSNSWGTIVENGSYDAFSQAYDSLVRDAQPVGSTMPAAGNQEMVIVFAAGNGGPGPRTVTTPGTAKNVISVGASENVHPFGGSDQCDTTDAEANSALDVAGLSGRGPAADGRMKPDIMLPGTHVSGGVAQESNVSPVAGVGSPLACFNAAGVCGGTDSSPRYFPAGQQWYTASTGTSFAAPAVAGFAALIRQHFINIGLHPPSPALTKALIMNSAEYMTGVAANDTLPSPNQGMGLADMDRFFAQSSQPNVIRDQMPEDTFTETGQQRVFSGVIADSNSSFRITLSWTDQPGSTAGSAFVNDLNLEVTVGGNTYRGNNFNGRYSSSGGIADLRNNSESVFLPAGESGPFEVRIQAANIAGNGIPGNGDSTDQDFALVISNAGEPAPDRTVRADFDGDDKTDLSVWRPENGNWYVNRSSGGLQIAGWGLDGDWIQPADLDGDSKTDLCVFRPTENLWYAISSSDNTVSTFGWGLSGDIPVIGRYSNAKRDSPAVWRPSSGRWYIFDGFREVEWGREGDLPTPGDFNGDGKTDFAVYRPSTGQWFLSIDNSVSVFELGQAGDHPVVADYDGDGKDDVAVWQPLTGIWFVRRIDADPLSQPWGLPGDIPVPGDFDGDGKYDFAVYRPSEGRWYILRTSAGIVVAEWGLPNDVPAPAAYVTHSSKF